MASTRVVSALGTADHVVLARQWRRSGQCMRCFHASTGRRAEGEPSPASKKVPTRQERAAKVSEEVSNLANATPPPIAPSNTARSTETTKSSTSEPKATNTQKIATSKKGSTQLKLAGKAFDPTPVTRRTFLEAGTGSATLAVPELVGVIRDHASKVKGAWDTISHLQHRARIGRKTTSDKRRAEYKAARYEATQRLIVGNIDERLAPGAPEHAQPVVGEVIKMALKNSTFLSLDVDKFSSKVASLLPASSSSSKEEALKRQRERREKLQANAAKN